MRQIRAPLMLKRLKKLEWKSRACMRCLKDKVKGSNKRPNFKKQGSTQLYAVGALRQRTDPHVFGDKLELIQCCQQWKYTKHGHSHFELG
jgi:hypothetical protein